MCGYLNYSYWVIAGWLDVVAFGEADFVFEAEFAAFEGGADFDAEARGVVHELFDAFAGDAAVEEFADAGLRLVEDRLKLLL